MVPFVVWLEVKKNGHVATANQWLTNVWFLDAAMQRWHAFQSLDCEALPRLAKHWRGKKKRHLACRCSVVLWKKKKSSKRVFISVAAAEEGEKLHCACSKWHYGCHIQGWWTFISLKCVTNIQKEMCHLLLALHADSNKGVQWRTTAKHFYAADLRRRSHLDPILKFKTQSAAVFLWFALRFTFGCDCSSQEHLLSGTLHF